MKPALFTAMISAIAMLAACGSQEKKKNEGKSQNSSSNTLTASNGFLSLSDLKKPSKLESLSKEAMIETLNDATDIYAEAPDDESGDCDKFFASQVVKADKSMILLEYTLSMDKCIKDKEIKSATVRVFTQHECTNGDLSIFDGKSLEFLRDKVEDACKDGDVRGIYHSEMTYEVDTKIEENKRFQYQAKVLTANVSPSGSACISKIKGDSYTRGECMEVSVTTYSNVKIDGKASELEGKYTKISSKDLPAKRKATYYTSGKADLIINNWSGTLTYNGAEKAPSWSMSDGSETAKGTFSGSSLLLRGLAQPHKKLFIKPPRP